MGSEMCIRDRWSLNPSDIDTAGGTATLRQVLATTAVTQSNDGLSCPNESIKEDEALPGSAGTANLVYHPNGGSSDPDDLQTTPAENVTLSAQEPTRDGYTFVEWNTNSDGTGDNYSPSDAYVMPGDGETDHLYAQWQVVPATTTTTSTSTTTTTTTTTTVAPETTTTTVPSDTTTTAAPTSTSTTTPEVTSTLAATEADDEAPIQLPSTGASPFSGNIALLIGVVGLLALVATRRRVH